MCDVRSHCTSVVRPTFSPSRCRTTTPFLSQYAFTPACMWCGHIAMTAASTSEWMIGCARVVIVRQANSLEPICNEPQWGGFALGSDHVCTQSFLAHDRALNASRQSDGHADRPIDQLLTGTCTNMYIHTHTSHIHTVSPCVCEGLLAGHVRVWQPRGTNACGTQRSPA